MKLPVPFYKLALSLTLLLSLCLTLTSLALAQDPIYVDKDASGNNTGLTWTDAYTDLQSALGAASYGDEIWVAEGLYTPGLNQSDTFTITNDIQLYGGFAATLRPPKPCVPNAIGQPTPPF